MAVAVIGGLFTSTAFSLLVVPLVYTYVDGIEKFFVRIWGQGPFHNRGAALVTAAKPLRADY
jgi:hypothetical protein